MLSSPDSLDQIPSLPQVLLDILDAIHSECDNFQSIAGIIRQDPATSARLIQAANSSYYARATECDTIERALMLMGTDTVKTLVITGAIKQFYQQLGESQPSGFLKPFWRRSLVNGNLAQVLATLTAYPEPNEAYLCGLLMELGQLLLLSEHQQAFLTLVSNSQNDLEQLSAEEQTFNNRHDQLAAELIDHWQLSSFMADAIRYHHADSRQVQDAHHLVKIMNAVSQLSEQRVPSDAALAAVDQLFGIQEPLTRELLKRIEGDVERLAVTLHIEISDTTDDHDRASQQQLNESLSTLNQLSQFTPELWQAKSRDELLSSCRRAVDLALRLPNTQLFLFDASTETLTLTLPNSSEQNPAFTLPFEAERSFVCDALLQRQPQSITAQQEATLSVIDRQLLRLGGNDSLVACPLLSEQQPVGVLLIPTAEPTQLQSQSWLIRHFCQQLARAILNHQQQSQQLASEPIANDEVQLKIREAVHEASNPLSIIRNYLELLNSKLGEGHVANQEIALIREEIERVGNILLRLKDPSQECVNDAVDANQMIRNLTQLLNQSLLSGREIRVELDLDEQAKTLEIPSSHLKQILTNLLKNAAEALTNGDQIRITTRDPVTHQGRSYFEITVADTGPGIPEPIRANLFSPVTSTKGGNHSGLGLSIAKKLMDEMGGEIRCQSDSSGTKFQILLPR